MFRWGLASDCRVVSTDKSYALAGSTSDRSQSRALWIRADSRRGSTVSPDSCHSDRKTTRGTHCHSGGDARRSAQGPLVDSVALC